MNKYLEKIAETEKKEKSKSTVSAGDKALAVVGGNLLGGSLASASIAPVANSALKNLSKDISNPDVSSTTKMDTLKRYIKDEDLSVDFNTDVDELKEIKTRPGKVPKGLDKKLIDHNQSLLRGMGHAVLPRGGKEGRDLINTPSLDKGRRFATDPTLHELGHSKDFQKHRKTKMYAPMGAKAIGGGASLYLLTDEDTAMYAPVATALSEMPTLRNEYVANRNAYNALKKYQGKADATKALRKTLGPAFGTYSTGAAAKIGASGVIAYMTKKLHESIRKKKEQKEGITKKAKKMTIDPVVKPPEPKDTVGSLKQKKGTDSITLLKSTERALEQTNRPKSLREIVNDKATQSYKKSLEKGRGDAVSDAVKKMQQASSTPRSSSNMTRQKLR